MKTSLHATISVVIATLIFTASSPIRAQSGGGAGLGRMLGNLGQQVEQSVLQQVRPYFPKAKTKLDQNGNLVIFTCLQNAGPSMLKQIQPEIENKFYSSPLYKQIGLALSGARRVEVGFERDVLVFDLNTHRDAWISGERLPGYIDGYGKVCN